MEKAVVGLELNVGGLQQAEESVKSFKTRLRESNQELFAMTEKFGATSVEAQNAAKKVANLKDAIGDAKQLSETFNPDKKFVALGGALSGAVSGFSALTGAMSLFGGESEETQKMLVKVQSAMALQQGISGVMGAVDSFKLLAAGIMKSSIFMKANNAVTAIAATVTKLFGVSVNTTATSFKVLKGAIAATGIGLLVVALGAAVQAFDSFTSAADRSADAQKKLNDEMLKSSKDSLKQLTDAATFEKNLAMAKAGSEAEKFQIEQDYKKKVFQLTTDHYDRIRTLDKDAANEAVHDLNRINNEGQVAAINEQKRLEKEKEEANKKALENQKAAQEKSLAARKKHLEDLQKAEENRIAQLQATDELITQNRLAAIKDEFTRSQMELDINRQAELDKENDNLNQKLISRETYLQRVALLNSNYQLAADALVAAKEEKDKEAQAAKDAANEAAMIAELQSQADLAEMKRQFIEAENEIHPEDTIETATAKIQEIEQAKLDAENAAFDAKILSLKGNDAMIEAETKAHEQRIKGIVKSSKEEQAAYEQKLHDVKKENLNREIDGVATGLETLSDIVGRNTGAGKAMAVAAATISAIRGAVGAFTGTIESIPGPVGIALAAVAAAGALAAGYANVKKIISVKVPGKYGHIGASTPSLALAAPSAPIRPNQERTVLDQSSIDGIGNAANRAYVLESDVRSSSERITRLNRAARIN